jgi:hypothetical protein
MAKITPKMLHQWLKNNPEHPDALDFIQYLKDTAERRARVRRPREELRVSIGSLIEQARVPRS